MNVANRASVTAMADHVIIRFYMGESETDDRPTEVAAVALPIVTGMNLALDIFGTIHGAMASLQDKFNAIQERITALNLVSAKK